MSSTSRPRAQPPRSSRAAKSNSRTRSFEIRVGGGLVERFRAFEESGELITPGPSARSLVSCLNSNETGHVWDVSDDFIVGLAS